MALPNIARFEEQAAETITNTLTGAVDKAFDGIRMIKDEIFSAFETSGGISEPLSQVKGLLTGGVSNAFEKIADIIPVWRKGGDRLEELVEDLGEKTDTGFDETVKSLDAIADQISWNFEKEKFDDQKITDAPVPDDIVADEEETGSSLKTMVMGFFGNIFKNLLRALPVVAIGAIALASFKDLFSEIEKGNEVGSAIGMNESASTFQTIIGGLQDDFASQMKAIGRWTTAGFVAGLPFGGPFAGGLIGALIGGAIGALVQGIQSWLGYEKFGAYIDDIVDSFDSTIEWFTGTNLERLHKRVDDMKRGRDHYIELQTKHYLKIEELEKKIQIERSKGNDTTARHLEAQLQKEKDKLDYYEGLIQDQEKKIDDFENDIENAHDGVIERMKRYSKDTANYIGTLPVRMIQSVWDAFTGDGWTDAYTKDHETFMKENFVTYFKDWSTNVVNDAWSWTTNAYDSISKSVRENINSAMTEIDKFVDKAFDYDYVGEFDKLFSETIPNIMGDMFDGFKKKLSDAFGYLSELGKVMYDEISLSDFNPFGDGPSYRERVAERMNDMESSRRISDDAARVNGNTEGAFNAIKESFDAELQRSLSVSQVNQSQTNVSNNQYISPGLNPKNNDSSSYMMDLVANGVIQSP